MLTENSKIFRIKSLTKAVHQINLNTVKSKGKQFDTRNLPDMAGELRGGNVRTASLELHISPALSGFSFREK